MTRCFIGEAGFCLAFYKENETIAGNFSKQLIVSIAIFLATFFKKVHPGEREL
jgi:hypothetical protein